MQNNFMQAMCELLNATNTISFNRFLARQIGVYETIIYSVLLTKAVYCEKNNLFDNDGYFYYTIEDLYESTSLTRRQQDTALKHLSEIGLIEYVIKGMPAKRHFKVCDNFELLNKLIGQDK